MKIKDKEHQFLGLKELNELVMEYPNDAALGRHIREMYWKKREIHKKRGGWTDATPT